MKWWERIWFSIGGLMLIDPQTVMDIIGIAMLGMGLFIQWRENKSGKKMEPIS
jgi:TRAP-type uncharacterized transport system fused permease subunit